MLSAKPSSASTALHRMSGIIRGDDTGGRAVFSSLDAPAHAFRGAAGIEKNSMAHKARNWKWLLTSKYNNTR